MPKIIGKPLWYVFLDVSTEFKQNYYFVGRCSESDTGFLQDFCKDFIFVNPLYINDFISDFCGGDMNV